MIFSGITLVLALSASIKGVAAPVPPPPPPSFGTTVSKVFNSVRNGVDVAAWVRSKTPLPSNESFGAVLAKVWELDLRSMMHSPCDLLGIIRRVRSTYTNTTVPPRSQNTAGLGNAGNVSFANLRRRFGPPKELPPPPPSFPSKAWLPNAVKIIQEESGTLWAGSKSSFDMGAVIAKVHGIPSSLRIKTISTTAFMLSVSKLMLHAGELHDKKLEDIKAATTKILEAVLVVTSKYTPTRLSTIITSSLPKTSIIIEEARIVLEKSLIEVAIGQVPVDEFFREVYETARNRCVYIVGVSVAVRMVRMMKPHLHQTEVDFHRPWGQGESDIDRMLDELDARSPVLEPSLVEEFEQISEHSPVVVEPPTLGIVQKGIGRLAFGLGSILGYTRALLQDAFQVCRTFSWLYIFLCVNGVFLLVCIWNGYDHQRSVKRRNFGVRKKDVRR